MRRSVCVIISFLYLLCLWGCSPHGRARLDGNSSDMLLPKTLEECQKDLSSDPANAGAYLNLSFAYFQLGHYGKAVEACKQAIRINPNIYQSYTGLAGIYIRLGQLNEAMDAYRKAILISCVDPEVYFGFGWIYNAKGQKKNAVRSLREAINISPDNVKARYLLGMILYEMGLFNKSVESLSRGIGYDPLNANFTIGRAYVKLKNYEKAIEVFKKVISAYPDFVKAHYALASTYLQVGRVDEAAKSYERAIQINPNDAYAYYKLGFIYNRAKDHGKAIEACKQSILLDSQYGELCYFELGLAYSSLQQWENARETFERAASSNPKEAKFQYFLGSISSLLRRYEEAVKAFKEAIALSPENGEAYYGLAVACAHLGQTEESKRAYEKAFSINPALIKNARDMRILNTSESGPVQSIEEYKKELGIDSEDKCLVNQVFTSYGRIVVGMRSEDVAVIFPGYLVNVQRNWRNNCIEQLCVQALEVKLTENGEKQKADVVFFAEKDKISKIKLLRSENSNDRSVWQNR